MVKKEKWEEEGCSGCSDDFLKNVCKRLPAPYSGRCWKLMEDLLGGKITSEQFGEKSIKIPGLLSKVREEASRTKR